MKGNCHVQDVRFEKIAIANVGAYSQHRIVNGGKYSPVFGDIGFASLGW